MQEAFISTNRVCTLSFHQFDPDKGFFPGSGNYNEIGQDQGLFCSINAPLKEGLSDNNFTFIFKNTVDKTIECFQPDVIWMQCGADSLQGDTIGCFNLSIQAHAEAIRHVMKKNIPIVFNGGGGYHVENVVRCWTYETMAICQTEDDDMMLPEESKYRKNFSSPELLYLRKNVHGIFSDKNSDKYCSSLLEVLFDGISKLDNSVGFIDKREGMNHLLKYVNYLNH